MREQRVYFAMVVRNRERGEGESGTHVREKRGKGKWVEVGVKAQFSHGSRQQTEKDVVCMVTACDNSCEIVSFIVGVIIIIVTLRVSTTIA